MIELKPCPFCGGEPKLIDNFIVCEKCATRMERAIVYPRWHESTELIQRWNTRHERTCRMADNGDYTMTCSCGEEIDWHMTDHYADCTAEYSYSYCPHCGARVERDA